MPSKELIEKVALAIMHDENTYRVGGEEYCETVARIAISTILAALQEPTEGMREVGMEAIDDNWERGIMRPSANSPSTCWRAMLAASALGEQAE